MRAHSKDVFLGGLLETTPRGEDQARPLGRRSDGSRVARAHASRLSRVCVARVHCGAVRCSPRVALIGSRGVTSDLVVDPLAPPRAAPAGARRLRPAAVVLLACALALVVRAPAGARTLAESSPLHGAATLFHPYPLALLDNAVASVVNPAGLGVVPSAEFFGLITDSDAARDGDLAVLLKMRRLGLAFERSRPFADRDRVTRLTVAHGRPLGSRLTAGASYAWCFSGDSKLAELSSADAGLTYRAGTRVALAASALGINEPKLDGVRLARTYLAGVAARPALDWLTLFGEGSLLAGSRAEDGVAAYGLVVEPVHGILVRGRADTDGDFRFGFEYNIHQSAYGVVGLYDSGGESDGRAGYLRLNDTEYRRCRAAED
jgi:hypothetical protein